MAARILDNFRTHHQLDVDLIPYAEIAKELGFAHAASARNIYMRAMRKLRWSLTHKEKELKELYRPEPEQAERVADVWRVSELPLSKFPLQPRRRK